MHHTCNVSLCYYHWPHQCPIFYHQIAIKNDLQFVRIVVLTKESVNDQVLGEVSRVWHTHTVNTTPTTYLLVPKVVT